jgi:hypothetical protein
MHLLHIVERNGSLLVHLGTETAVAINLVAGGRAGAREGAREGTRGTGVGCERRGVTNGERGGQE